MSTCNRLDLQPLGSPPVMPKNLPGSLTSIHSNQALLLSNVFLDSQSAKPNPFALKCVFTHSIHLGQMFLNYGILSLFAFKHAFALSIHSSHMLLNSNEPSCSQICFALLIHSSHIRWN